MADVSIVAITLGGTIARKSDADNTPLSIDAGRAIATRALVAGRTLATLAGFDAPGIAVLTIDGDALHTGADTRDLAATVAIVNFMCRHDRPSVSAA